MADLVPQPHGGAITPPFGKGNAVAARGGFRKHQREFYRLLSEKTPDAARRIVEMVDSTDERIAIMAVGLLTERVLGKASEAPMGGVQEDARADLSHLTNDEKTALTAHYGEVRRLLALARDRQTRAEGGVIEGVAARGEGGP